MDQSAIIAGGSWIFVGAVCIAVSIPLVMGRIPPNHFYGVRLPQSFKSEQAWYAINRYGGRRLIVWSIPMILAGAVCMFLPLREHATWAIIVSFAPIVFVLIAVLEMWRFARRYDRNG